MPRQQGPGFVFAQLALSGKALRREEERWEDLEEHCHDPQTLAELRAQREAVEEAQDSLWDYLMQVAERLQRTSELWALDALRNEPSVADLKVRPIRQAKTPTVSAVSA